MTMKKWTALLLAVVMVFTLAACTGGDDVGGTVTNITTTAGGTTTTTTDATTTTTTTTAAGTATDEKAFATGTNDGTTYENTFIGIGCTLDGDWEFSSDEDIREMNELTLEMMGDDYAAAIQNAEIVYDMMANNLTTGDSININLENLDLLYGSVLSEEEYVDMALPTMQELFGGEGMEGTTIEKATFTLAGQEHYGFNVSMTMMGIEIHEAVVCVKAGSYMACITVASSTKESVTDLLAKFYAV